MNRISFRYPLIPNCTLTEVTVHILMVKYAQYYSMPVLTIPTAKKHLWLVVKHACS